MDDTSVQILFLLSIFSPFTVTARLCSHIYMLRCPLRVSSVRNGDKSESENMMSNWVIDHIELWGCQSSPTSITCHPFVRIIYTG